MSRLRAGPPWGPVAALAVAALARTAAAQPPPPPPASPPPPPAAPVPAPAPEFHDQGVLLGGALGLGWLALRNDTGDSASFSGTGIGLYFGGMLTPRLGLAFEWLGVASEDEDDLGYPVRVSQHSYGAWLRYWATPRLWVQGGLAAVRLVQKSDFEDPPSVPGTSLLLGAGLEMLHRPAWSLDAVLRFGATGYKQDGLSSNTFALLLALTWF